jgi:hypothetical protein
MKGQQIPYSAEELAWIRQRATDPRPATHAAFCARFDRADVSLQNLNALCKRKGWLTGRTGCFAPGGVPANKGRTMPFNANSAATRFKQGSRSGRADELYKPIGTERLTKDGYRQRKMHDGLPMQSRWQLVQRVEWEAANGPVPDGYALKCLNGDRHDCRPSNWEAVPRAVLARLNEGRHRTQIGYDAAPAELKPTVMAIAKLKHAAQVARQSREQTA